MIATVARWGNSLALRIPRELASSICVVEGTHVELRASRGTLVVAPTRPKYKLADLLAEFRPEHREQEHDWGKPAGREVW